jgi:hypothetical protein
MKRKVKRAGKERKGRKRMQGMALAWSPGPPSVQADELLDGQFRAADGSPPPINLGPSGEGLAILTYFKAQRRSFASADELSGWVEAERDLERGDAALLEETDTDEIRKGLLLKSP